MTNNPYQAPATDALANYCELPTATMGWRLINMLLDYLFLNIIAFVVVFLAALAGLANFLPAEDQRFSWILVNIAAFSTYYFVQEALWGKTLAKRITKTLVLTEADQPIGFKHALSRTLCRLIPFEAFSFLTAEQPRGLHDTISNTRVASTRPSDLAKAKQVEEKQAAVNP